jgi:hypothetical protein
VSSNNAEQPVGRARERRKSARWKLVPLRFLDSESSVAGEHVEVGIGVEHRDVGLDCDGGDEAVDQPSNRFATAATAAIERGSCF